MNQNDEPDCFALIAAKTVECFNYAKDSSAHLNLGCICKGSGRVLDQRFERLRGKCNHWFHALTPICPGYTVVRDLAVLLESAEAALNQITLTTDISLLVSRGKWTAFVSPIAKNGAYYGGGDIPLEAAAKAVWEWLKAEEKEHSHD